MNNEDDAFLTSLLQYNSTMVDQAFIKQVLDKVQAKNKMRSKLLCGAFLFALAIAMPILIDVINSIYRIDNLLEYSVAFLFATLTIGVWVTSEDF